MNIYVFVRHIPKKHLLSQLVPSKSDIGAPCNVKPSATAMPASKRTETWSRSKWAGRATVAKWGVTCNVLRESVIQKNCNNTPLEHTPNNPPSQLWKESLHSLLVKVKGVCSKGVVKQPETVGWHMFARNKGSVHPLLQHLLGQKLSKKKHNCSSYWC